MARRKTRSAPVEGRVVDLTHEGKGVVREEGKAVFVPGALPDEHIRYRVIKSRRDYNEAELLEVLAPSPHRVTPRCEHFGICGGCSLQHLDPEQQRGWKQKILLDNLQRIGHVEPEQVWQPVSASSWGYRRKARLGAKFVYKKGRVLVGFREKGKPYIADLNQCEVLVPQVGKKLSDLAALIAGLSVYQHIPQIEVAAGDDQTALVMRNLQPLTEADQQQLVAFAKKEGFAIYLQPGGPDSITPLYPQHPQLTYAIAEQDIQLAFEPTDFVQVNGAINDQMVRRVLEELQLTHEDAVLELFSGLGNFSLAMAKRAANVTAVEGEAALVERARANAAMQGIDNIKHHVADLSEEVNALPWSRGASYHKVLLDPPRSGAMALLPALKAFGARRIVYVSCNPATLARDADVLVNQYGYHLRGAGILDMFPHTAHVESMAVFEKAA